MLIIIIIIIIVGKMEKTKKGVYGVVLHIYACICIYFSTFRKKSKKERKNKMEMGEFSLLFINNCARLERVE